ncbi:MAG: cytochrome c [Bdellovibrionales bacterium]|nr:cytochrome c [Bdellovibrionales bacterium]
MKWSKVLLFSLSSLLVACNGGDNKTNIELMPDMFDQVSLKAQDWDPNKDGKGSQLVPPQNTVPRGKPYIKHMEDFSDAEKNLTNPWANDFTPEIIELGKKKYDVYCGMCHGDSGNGKGAVGLKMLVPPRNFLEERVVKFSDGRIYWAIVKGFGTMGHYANQVRTEKERWAVVNYVRTLQKQSQ